MPHATAAVEMQECIQNCLDCRQACKEALAHSVRRGGKSVTPGHLQALVDCIVLCHASADLMTGGSPLHAKECGVCAEACRRCADSCADVGLDGEVMARCAEACRRCADSCDAMSRM
jgi:hypothetical protein